MEVRISFAEVKEYVASHFNQNIELEHNGSKEITLFYTKRVFIKDLRIGIKLIVEAVSADSVSLSLNAGTALNLMISGALLFIKNHFAELTEGISNEGNRITVHLTKIKQAEKIVEKVALKDIEFTPDDIILTAALK